MIQATEKDSCFEKCEGWAQSSFSDEELEKDLCCAIKFTVGDEDSSIRCSLYDSGITEDLEDL